MDLSCRRRLVMSVISAMIRLMCNDQRKEGWGEGVWGAGLEGQPASRAGLSPCAVTGWLYPHIRR